MPILNYTTKVSASKTVSEIQSILGRKGARRVSVVYGHGAPSGIDFELDTLGLTLNYRLPCNFGGVSACLRKEGMSSIARDNEQCIRIAWRIVKDWVEAQIALVESGQADMAEVFFPYALHESGVPMFQVFVGGLQKQLGDGTKI